MNPLHTIREVGDLSYGEIGVVKRVQREVFPLAGAPGVYPGEPSIPPLKQTDKRML